MVKVIIGGLIGALVFMGGVAAILLGYLCYLRIKRATEKKEKERRLRSRKMRSKLEVATIMKDSSTQADETVSASFKHHQEQLNMSRTVETQVD